MNFETDPAAIQRLLEAGGPKLVQDMVRLFLENTPRRIVSALAGLRGADLPAVERAGHSLKSSAEYLGLRSVAERAARVEELASQGRGVEVGPLVLELSESLPAVRDHLKKVLDSL